LDLQGFPPLQDFISITYNGKEIPILQKALILDAQPLERVFRLLVQPIAQDVHFDRSIQNQHISNILYSQNDLHFNNSFNKETGLIQTDLFRVQTTHRIWWNGDTWNFEEVIYECLYLDLSFCGNIEAFRDAKRDLRKYDLDNGLLESWSIKEQPVIFTNIENQLVDRSTFFQLLHVPEPSPRLDLDKIIESQNLWLTLFFSSTIILVALITYYKKIRKGNQSNDEELYPKINEKSID